VHKALRENTFRHRTLSRRGTEKGGHLGLHVCREPG
jgi:hypothetical protein